jgi:GNAT superfamily N-acetyltransferase
MEQVYNYLNKRPLLHVMMTEALKSPAAEVVYADNDGVMIGYKGFLFMSATDEKTVDIMLRNANKKSLAVLCGSVGLDKVRDFYGPGFYMDCCQAVYTKKEKLHIPYKADMCRLDVSNFDFVRKHYHTVDNDEDYIRERLEGGLMYGCYIRGELAGFIGRHDEGSMGLLEVLPEYRRLGIGSALEAYMINLMLDEGNVPFCQLRVENEKSLRLQQKLGLEIAPEHIYWIG